MNAIYGTQTSVDWASLDAEVAQLAPGELLPLKLDRCPALDAELEAELAQLAPGKLLPLKLDF